MTSKNPSLVTLKNVGFFRSGRWLIRGVNLTVNYGEILTPNGACYVCDENEFSIKKGDTKCEDCPDEAVCLGGI